MTARYMIATTAVHKLGDISRDRPDLCVIHDEDDEAYIGNWVTGLGYINVRFPKASTRELTAEEREFYGHHDIVLNGRATPIDIPNDKPSEVAK